MSLAEGELMVTVTWHANPFRADKFEDAWRPACALAIDYGASWWTLLRSLDDPSDFFQMASFPTREDWERYWYSAQISDARAEAHGLYQVPILPVFQRVKGAGEIEQQPGGVA